MLASLWQPCIKKGCYKAEISIWVCNCILRGRSKDTNNLYIPAIMCQVGSHRTVVELQNTRVVIELYHY